MSQTEKYTITLKKIFLSFLQWCSNRYVYRCFWMNTYFNNYADTVQSFNGVDYGVTEHISDRTIKQEISLSINKTMLQLEL